MSTNCLTVIAAVACQGFGEFFMDKASLRKHFIPRRKGAHVGDPAEVAQRVQALLPSEDFVLASYLPIRGEWDPWPVIQAMPAHETAIPLTPKDPGPLTFRRWAWGDDTVEAMFKTREPRPTAPLVPLEKLVFLVPGVAIDMNGIRLGYGGGYYDRTFAALGASLDRARVIGFMLDEQVSETALPREATDIPLGHLITPTRSMSFI